MWSNKKKIFILGSASLVLILASVLIANLNLPKISLPISPLTIETTTVSENIYYVSKVIDGDTFELENGERVRMIGIDTPEVYNFGNPKECFSNEASEHTKSLIEGKYVRLEKDISDRDKFDRLLRYVYIGDKLINEELVKNGFAYAKAYPPDILQEDLFAKSENLARTNKVGLWGKCPE